MLGTPGRGFVLMAPGVVLIFWWLWNQWHGGDARMSLLLAGVALAVLIPISMTTSWHGAWTYGPRYALPLLPFLWLGVPPSMDILEEWRGGRSLAVILLLLGTITVLPGVLVDHTTHQDLAIKAARLEWPDLPGNEATQDEERFARFTEPLGVVLESWWRMTQARGPR